MPNPYEIRRAERIGMEDYEIPCALCGERANGGIRNFNGTPICYECRMRLRAEFLDGSLKDLESTALASGLDAKTLADFVLDMLDEIEDRYCEAI